MYYAAYVYTVYDAKDFQWNVSPTMCMWPETDLPNSFMTRKEMANEIQNHWILVIVG